MGVPEGGTWGGGASQGTEGRARPRSGGGGPPGKANVGDGDGDGAGLERGRPPAARPLPALKADGKRPGSLGRTPGGPAESRRGFQNQRPPAQRLAQHPRPRAPSPGPCCTSVARAWEPKGASRPGRRAEDVCTVSQRRCGALITHSSTKAGDQASRRPTPLLPPARGRPREGAGRARCRQRPNCTARGRGPGPV